MRNPTDHRGDSSPERLLLGGVETMGLISDIAKNKKFLRAGHMVQ